MPDRKYLDYEGLRLYDSKIKNHISNSVNNKADASALSQVAFTGSYEDLADQPFYDHSKTLVDIEFKETVSYWESDYDNILTSGEFIPLVEGDVYNITYNGVLYENVEVQSLTVNFNEDSEPYNTLYLGNAAEAFFKDFDWASRLSPSEVQRLISLKTDLPFSIYFSKGEDYSEACLWGYAEDDSTCTIEVTDANDNSKSYTLEIEPYAYRKDYFGEGLTYDYDSFIEEFHPEEGSTITLNIDGTERTSEWINGSEDWEDGGDIYINNVWYANFLDENDEDIATFGVSKLTKNGEPNQEFSSIGKNSAGIISLIEEDIKKIDRKFIPEEEKEPVIKDWSENDEESPNYIGNRTHYVQEGGTELISEFSVTLNQYHSSGSGGLYYFVGGAPVIDNKYPDAPVENKRTVESLRLLKKLFESQVFEYTDQGRVCDDPVTFDVTVDNKKYTGLTIGYNTEATPIDYYWIGRLTGGVIPSQYPQDCNFSIEYQIWPQFESGSSQGVTSVVSFDESFTICMPDEPEGTSHKIRIERHSNTLETPKTLDDKFISDDIPRVNEVSLLVPKATEFESGKIKISDLPCYTSQLTEIYRDSQFPFYDSNRHDFDFLENDYTENPGVLYTVVIDGRVYSHVPIYHGNDAFPTTYTLGQSSQTDGTSDSNPEQVDYTIAQFPFSFRIGNDNTCWWQIEGDRVSNSKYGRNTHSIVIYKEGTETVHKLDNKYLDIESIEDEVINGLFTEP